MAKRAGPGEAETLQYLDSERVRLDGGTRRVETKFRADEAGNMPKLYALVRAP